MSATDDPPVDPTARNVFAAAARPVPDPAHPGAARWEVPTGWNQGRGAWGGLVVAAGVRAAQGAVAGDSGGGSLPVRPVRSVSAQLAAPVPPGSVRIAIEDIRRGSATATRRVVMSASDAVPGADALAQLTVLSGDDRRDVDDAGLGSPARPHAPAPDDVAVIPIGPPLGPEFAQRLSFAPISGLPYGGSGEEVLCWIAPAQPEESTGTDLVGYDEGSLLGMVDALWPAVLTRFTAVRPVATVDFLATLLVDPRTVDPTEPLLHRGRVVAAHGGYVTELRELWTRDGRLAVANQQVIAIIR